MRSGSEARWKALQRDLSRHYRRLALFGFGPADLLVDVGVPTGMRWSARRLCLLGVPTVVLAVVGHVVFWIPFQATRYLTQKARPALDRISTYKLLIGILAYSVWVLALSVAGGWAGVWSAGAALAGLLPPLGVASLWIRERGRWGYRDVRRFMIMRTRGDVLGELLSEQQRLGAELQELVAAWDAGLLQADVDR